MKIAVINKSSTDYATLKRWVAACQVQLDRDFAKHWFFTANVRAVPPGERALPDEWQMIIVDEVEGGDCLGYHDRDEKGRPRGFVGVKTTIANGGKPSVTLSHELLEMRLSPWLWEAALTPLKNIQAVSVEACDPVQADEYEIDGVAVSNFILPAWMDEHGRAPFDFLGKLKKPFTMTRGGYCIIWSPRKGWHDLDEGEVRKQKAAKSRTVRIRGQRKSGKQTLLKDAHATLLRGRSLLRRIDRFLAQQDAA